MRYLVKANVRPGEAQDLLTAIDRRTLGRGSVAAGEYLRNMRAARRADDGTVRWVEICYCSTPLDEERPYWEQFFDLKRIQDAHPRSLCRHENGTQTWACENCDCTQRLERNLARRGRSFLEWLRAEASDSTE